MGNSLDPYGKPVFDDTFNLPADLQAAVEFTDEFANLRRGKSADRLSLSPGKHRAGALWLETDTGLLYEDTGSGWEQRMAGPATVEGNPGAAISGILVPGAAASLPRGVSIKTGMVTATTSTAFGNEYMPRVAFKQAFPTSLLSVSILQVHTDGALAFANVAVDDATKTGFRVLYPGTSTTSKRSFMWTAFGY